MAAQILALLEDDQLSCQVVDSLKLSGHEVIVAKNINQAIKILQTMHVLENKGVGMIVLIISDVHLQDGSSVFDLLKWVKAHPPTKDVPFVLFSPKPSELAKYIEDGVRVAARVLGAAMYITMETFDSYEFRRQIDSLVPNYLGCTSSEWRQRI
jgi:CheY-like chemotaxis protein